MAAAPSGPMLFPPRLHSATRHHRRSHARMPHHTHRHPSPARQHTLPAHWHPSPARLALRHRVSPPQRHHQRTHRNHVLQRLQLGHTGQATADGSCNLGPDAVPAQAAQRHRTPQAQPRTHAAPHTGTPARTPTHSARTLAPQPRTPCATGSRGCNGTTYTHTATTYFSLCSWGTLARPRQMAAAPSGPMLFPPRLHSATRHHRRKQPHM
jgi:hypothetical protein